MSEVFEVVIVFDNRKPADDLAAAIDRWTVLDVVVRKVNPDAHPE